MCKVTDRQFKDVSFGQNCLNLIFEQYLSSETYPRKYEKQQNKVIHACKNKLQKMYLLKMCARKLGFVFMFRPI